MMFATSTSNQFLFSFYFVVTLPAFVQTAAAYVWALQIRRSKVRIPDGIEEDELQDPDDSLKQNHKGRKYKFDTNRRVKDFPTRQERTLFLYRILACITCLSVLLFSTLPQLVFAVSRPPSDNTLQLRWGWSQFIIYADHATRCFGCYFIVIPYTMMFWNFCFNEIVHKPRLVVKNVFVVILKSSILIGLLAFIPTIPIIVKRCLKLCNASDCTCRVETYYVNVMIYYDFIVTRVIPELIILVVLIGFFRWLPKNDRGVLLEPAIFLLFTTPMLFSECVLFIFHSLQIGHRLISSYYSNFMLITYAVYHMSFSSSFVLATIGSVISEIRDEIRKRQRLYLDELDTGDETPATAAFGNTESAAERRRAKLVKGLQQQFSVAFRWKPEEEEESLACSPLEASPFDIAFANEQSPLPSNDLALNAPNSTMNDDGKIHYAVLHYSTHLKKHQLDPFNR